MRARRLLATALTGALLLATAGPAAAQTSCVGWYASTYAQEDPQGFAAEISWLARNEQPFGWRTVAPFAHAALEDCQG